MPAADNQEMKGVRLLDFFSGGLSTSWSEAELSTLLNFILKRLEHRRRRRRKKRRRKRAAEERKRGKKELPSRKLKLLLKGKFVEDYY